MVKIKATYNSKFGKDAKQTELLYSAGRNI